MSTKEQALREFVMQNRAMDRHELVRQAVERFGTLPLSAEAVTGPSGTPSSQWRANGEVDPHAGHYDGERAALCMGSLTDDELANGAFMNYDRRPHPQEIIAGTAHSPIAWMTAVKDRIRWLSRSLEKALRSPPVAAPADGFKLVPAKVTQEMHVAAVKVLLRANGLDGLPQRMLDAMLSVAPAAATTTGEAAAPDVQPVSDNGAAGPEWTEEDKRESEYMARWPDDASQAHGKSEAVAWWIPAAEQFCLAKKDGSRPFASAWQPLYAAPQPAPAHPDFKVTAGHDSAPLLLNLLATIHGDDGKHTNTVGLQRSVKDAARKVGRPAQAHPDANSGVEFAGWQERHRAHGGEWSRWADVGTQDLEYRRRHARDNPHYNQIRQVFAALQAEKGGDRG